MTIPKHDDLDPGWADVPDLIRSHAAHLQAQAITPEIAKGRVFSDRKPQGNGRPGITFIYRGADGSEVEVYRATDEERAKNPEQKYLSPKGVAPPVTQIIDEPSDHTVIICEGTQQALAV